MKKLLSYIFPLLSSSFFCAQAQEVSYTKEDSLRVVELLNLGSKAPANEPPTLFYAKQLMNRPYVAHTLEIKDMEEHLAINLQSLDCTTLVENCCALALTTSHGSKSWKDYLAWLQKLRYDAGKIDGYKSRNHYFSQWIQSGTKLGLVKEIVPPTSISVPMKLSLTYMSEHPDSYPLLKVNMEERKHIAEMEKRASGATVRYIPKERVGDSKQEGAQLRQGRRYHRHHDQQERPGCKSRRLCCLGEGRQIASAQCQQHPQESRARTHDALRIHAETPCPNGP